MQTWNETQNKEKMRVNSKSYQYTKQAATSQKIVWVWQTNRPNRDYLKGVSESKIWEWVKMSAVLNLSAFLFAYWKNQECVECQDFLCTEGWKDLTCQAGLFLDWRLRLWQEAEQPASAPAIAIGPSPEALWSTPANKISHVVLWSSSANGLCLGTFCSTSANRCFLGLPWNTSANWFSPSLPNASIFGAQAKTQYLPLASAGG